MPTDKNKVPYFEKYLQHYEKDSTSFSTNGFRKDTNESLTGVCQIFNSSQYADAQFYSCFN